MKVKVRFYRWLAYQIASLTYIVAHKCLQNLQYKEAGELFLLRNRLLSRLEKANLNKKF